MTVRSRSRSARSIGRRVAERSPAGYRVGGLWRAVREPDRDDPLLLDTHAWFWTLNGELGGMATEAADLIASAASNGRLFVSDISFWELSLKAAKGKLALATDPTLWLAKAAEAQGIVGLPLSREVLVQSTLLPGEPHGDPVDRMLLAQAQLRGLSLLTCDRLIIDYAARQPGIPVCDARRSAR